MKRLHVTLIVMLGAGGLIVMDQAQSTPLNPYAAPPMLALGSGLAATGGHCAAPPPPAR